MTAISRCWSGRSRVGCQDGHGAVPRSVAVWCLPSRGQAGDVGAGVLAAAALPDRTPAFLLPSADVPVWWLLALAFFTLVVLFLYRFRRRLWLRAATSDQGNFELQRPPAPQAMRLRRAGARSHDLSSLLEAAAVGLLVVREGRILYANVVAAGWLGCDSPEELLSVTDPERLFLEPDRFRARRLFGGGHTATGKAETVLLRPRMEGVLTVWLEARAGFVCWQGRDATLITLTDASEWVREQRRLTESEERYRELVERTDDLLTQVDAGGRFLFVNHPSRRIFGLDPEECVGRSAFDFIHPDDRERTRAWFEQCLRTGTGNSSIENRQVAVDGRVSTVLWNCHFLHDDAGRLVSVTSIARDITEMKQTQRALRESESRFHSVVRALPVGLFICQLDEQGRLVLLEGNPAADRILGIDSRNLVGLALEEAFPRSEVAGISEACRQVVETGRSWHQARFRCLDRKRREDRVFELHAFQVAPGRVAILFKDVSLRVRQAEDLARRASFQQLLAEMAGRFVRRPFEEVEEGVGQTLQKMADWFRVDGVYLFRYYGAGTPRVKSGFWQRDTLDVTAADLVRLGPGRFPWGTARLKRLDPLVVADVADLPAEAEAEKDFLSSRGVGALLVVPLLQRNRLAGFLALADCRGPRPWLADEIEALRVVGHQFSMVFQGHQARRALQLSEERFRTMFQAIPDAILLLRPDGRIIDCNEVFLRQVGRTKEEVMGCTTDRLGLWNGRENPLPALDHVGQSRFEADFMLPNGSLKSGLISVCPVRLGDADRQLVVIRDVTELKRARLALEEAGRKYRRLSREFQAILDSVQDPLLLFDRRLRVVWCNRGAVQALGDGQELNGRSCHQLFSHSQAACSDCPVRRTFDAGRPHTFSFETGDGRLWEVRTFPVLNDRRQVVNVVMAAQETTERVRLREEAVRAGQLASIGELAAGVAHEINNPINGIINYAQILHDALGGQDRWRDIASRILKEGDRIATIVTCLLSFSRLGGQVRSPVRIAEVIEDTLVLVRTQLQKDGIHLEVDVPADLPPVNIFQQQIQQVFMNLISNARYALNQKYPQSCPDKRLRIVCRRQDGCLAVLFHDQGTGIAPEHLRRVFNPFYTTKPVNEGTGLGLSISLGIVRDHGGELRIESEAGVCTRVWVLLPCEEEAEESSGAGPGQTAGLPLQSPPDHGK